jgi:hypothetical protein
MFGDPSARGAPLEDPPGWATDKEFWIRNTVWRETIFEGNLAVKNMGGESEAAWRALLDDLVKRGLKTPAFVIVDGAPKAGKRGDLPQGHAKERRLSTPPTNPSTVFDGESRGVILRRPSSLPQTYCKTSLDCTTNTRNAISRRLRPSKPGICSVSSAGTWEWQNTEIIDPQCTSATRPMKLMVSPRNAATLGTSRKT